MQEIHAYHEDHSRGLSRELIDRLVILEGPATDDAFLKRRAEALAKSTGRVDVREFRRVGRNDPCPCGSEKKFKKCCGSRLADNDERISE